MIQFRQQAVPVQQHRRQHDQPGNRIIAPAQHPCRQKRYRGYQHNGMVNPDKRHNQQRCQNRSQHRTHRIDRHDLTGIVTIKTIKITTQNRGDFSKQIRCRRQQQQRINKRLHNVGAYTNRIHGYKIKVNQQVRRGQHRHHRNDDKINRQHPANPIAANRNHRTAIITE